MSLTQLSLFPPRAHWLLHTRGVRRSAFLSHNEFSKPLLESEGLRLVLILYYIEHHIEL